MPGVGQQRDRSAGDAVARLDRDEREVERDPDRECPAEAGGGVAVPVTMAVLGVIVRHRDPGSVASR